MTEDIHFSPFGSIEQTNVKNSVDSYGNAKTDESDASNL